MLPMFVRRHNINPSVPLAAVTAGLISLSVALLCPPQSAHAQDNTTPAAQPPATPPTPINPPPPPAKNSDDDGDSGHISFGPEIGLYIPTDSKTRSAFGGTWFSVGLGLGEIRKASQSGRFQADFGLFGTSHSGGHQVYMAPLGVSYIRALNDNENSAPYVGASADIVLTQIRSDPDGIVSRIRGTGGGSVFIGEAINKKSYVQARYFLMGDVRGYNLSGVNLSYGYRF